MDQYAVQYYHAIACSGEPEDGVGDAERRSEMAEIGGFSRWIIHIAPGRTVGRTCIADKRMLQRPLHVSGMAASHSTHPATPSTSVIYEIAAHKESDPAELHPPIGSVVDLDALDALLGRNVHATVTFEYDDYQVEASNDGRVTVQERRVEE